MSFTKFRHAEDHDPVSGVMTYVKDQAWNIQPPPYKGPLQWISQGGQRTDSFGYLAEYQNNTGPSPPFNDVALSNRCYENFKGKSGESATMANNLLEGKQSVNMIVGAAASLASAAINIRRGNFGAAAKALGIRPKDIDPRKLKNQKSFGNKWLQYHFGWTPLVQDIGSAVNALQGNPGSSWIRGQASNSFQRINRTDAGGGYTSYERVDVRSRYAYRALMKVTNPNLHLADQMGFVNPLSVAWEAVPYSFVVDWFANVGQVLSSMTDFVGLDLRYQQSTFFQSGSRTAWYTNPGINSGAANGSSGKSYYVERNQTIPGPTLALKPFNGFSPTRGATAISLLLQHL